MADERMTEVRIRDVAEWVVESHRRTAKQAGRSLETELRELLTSIVLHRKQSLVEAMRSDLEELRQKHGQFPDSAAGIREDRERRG